MIGEQLVRGDRAGLRQDRADNVPRLEVLTYDGERFWAGPTSDEEYAGHRRAPGGRRAQIYRAPAGPVAVLRRLRSGSATRGSRGGCPATTWTRCCPSRASTSPGPLVGSESTLVTILHAELRLVPKPAAQALVVLGYPDIASAADAAPHIAPHQPEQLEGLDERLITFERERRMNPEALRLLPEGRGPAGPAG